MPSNRLLAVLSAAGLTAGLGLASADDATASTDLKAESAQALESFLQKQPTSAIAPEAFRELASRFKEPGDTGRPDIFGPPGPPEIGPPGQYPG